MLRLTTGQDIIGTVSDTGKGYYLVAEPMSVEIEHKGNHTGIAMAYWLPVQIIKNNTVILKYADILAILDPNDSLIEYYESTVEKFHEILKAKEVADSMTDDEMTEGFESIKLGKDSRVH